MSDGTDRANDIAAQIATTEMLRILINEAFYTDDLEEFRRRLSRFEDLAVAGITERRHFPEADDQTENYIREAASGYVSTVVSSIVHPKDPRRQRS